MAVADLREAARVSGYSSSFGSVAIDESLDIVAASSDQGSGTVIRSLSDPSFRVELAIDGPDQAQYGTQRVFSPSGRWLAEMRHKPENHVDRQLVVWDWRAQQIVHREPLVGEAALAFHPNDRHLFFERGLGPGVTEGSAFPRTIVDVTTGQTVSQSLRRFPAPRVAFSPDGKWLAIASHAVTAEIVDASTWETVATIPEAGMTDSVAWSPVDPSAIFGTADGRLYRWDHAQRQGRFLSGDRLGSIEAVSFSPDGRLLAASGSDLVFDLRYLSGDRVLLRSPGQVLGFSRDSQRFAALRDDQLVIYDRLDDAAFTRLPRGCDAAEFSPDGNWLTTSGVDGVQLYLADTLAQKADLGLDRCGPVAFHPDGSGLVTFGAFSHAQDWPTRIVDRSAIQRSDRGAISDDEKMEPWRMGPPQPLMHRAGANSLLQSLTLAPQHQGLHAAWSRDGRVLALADYRQDRILITGPDATEPARVFAPSATVTRVAVSPDGQWIAAGAHHHYKHAGVFRTADAQAVLDNLDHGNVAFSSDGEYFASASLSEVRIYRVGSWQLARTIPIDRPPNGQSAPIAFQPNGRLVAVSDSVHRTRLYDRESGRNVANLTHSLSETAQPHWLSFSPDGTRLAVTRISYDVGIWDLCVLQAELSGLGLEANGLPANSLDRNAAGLRGFAAFAHAYQPPREFKTPDVAVDRGPQLVPPEHWYKFWYRLARHEASRGIWPDAIGNINRALDQHQRPAGQDRAELLQLRGTYQLRYGDARAARADWEQAISLAPKQANAVRLLARMLVLGPPEHRDPEQALALIAGLATDPNPAPEDLLLLGIAQVRLARYEHGLVTLNKVADLEATQPLAPFFIAIAQHQLGNRGEAVISNDQAVEWMKQHHSEDAELLRVQAEAAEVLGK